jgi:hypothetical protein
MYVCNICVCMFAYECISVCMHVCIYALLYAFIYMHACICAYEYIYARVYVYIYIYICVCVCVCVFTYTCMHVCMLHVCILHACLYVSLSRLVWMWSSAHDAEEKRGYKFGSYRMRRQGRLIFVSGHSKILGWNHIQATAAFLKILLNLAFVSHPAIRRCRGIFPALPAPHVNSWNCMPPYPPYIFEIDTEAYETFLNWVTGLPSPRIKRPGRETDHLH